ncbi:hypothetical protein IPZ58_34790 [Streptomyces roseoverticillatus]|nr:hypothetical protein [Streptomyces roseoverticillatus]MCF3106697.1 hypothetical protein [Streptomyces roseoverticillatus]
MDEKKTCASPELVGTGTFEVGTGAFEGDTQGWWRDFRDGPSGRRDR